MTDWFQDWFGEEYLRLYPHRDDEEARHAVALVGRVAPLSGARVLDLACGQGRHSQALAELGARVTGLDLSSVLLRRARARLGDAVRLIRGDMRRLPFRSGSFDLVVNLFTSFGYFADDSDDLAVLADVRRVLRPGGRFVIDYFNSARVTRDLVANEDKTIDGHRINIRRHVSADGRFVVKEMTPEGRKTFVERVRLHTPSDLEGLLRTAGLTIESRFGDYAGSALSAGAPRTILAAVRA